MSKISESKGVEIPIYNWLGQMGWTPRTSEELTQFNRPLSNPLIEGILIQKVHEINRVPLADAKRAVDILKNAFANPSVITANEGFLELLCTGVNLVIEGQDRTLRLLDFENIWNNDFTVTRQYYVQGTDLVKPDLVCLVNGIPLIPFEAKQRAHQNSNWLKGVTDLTLYESKIPRMVVCNLFAMACNGRVGKYGVPGASSSYFAEWKDLSVDKTPGNPLLTPGQTLCPVAPDKDGNPVCRIDDLEKMKQTVVGLLQPARVLDILRNFIVFERTDDKGVVKKVSRYQQLRVASKIVERVAATDLDQGVAWHTQGSGKSLRVCEDGSVKLVVPKDFTAGEIESLLRKKAEWIDRHREFFRTQARNAPRLGADEVMLFGEVFRWVAAAEAWRQVVVDRETKVIRAGGQAADHRRRQQRLRGFASEYLRQRLEQLARKHGFRYERCFVLSQRTRWGSCSKRRNVSLNWRLVAAPEYAIDYVILHELVHTRVMDHSHRFWVNLRAVCPDHGRAMKWLRANQPESGLRPVAEDRTAVSTVLSHTPHGDHRPGPKRLHRSPLVPSAAEAGARSQEI